MFRTRNEGKGLRNALAFANRSFVAICPAFWAMEIHSALIGHTTDTQGLVEIMFCRGLRRVLLMGNSVTQSVPGYAAM
jgi:hypothetical protein